ncbi:MAG TPA: hypothetical protein VE669_01700, partial [Actinomycetota bacterium]|nr:hypothetical protein [Actinomycetota bacterium]
MRRTILGLAVAALVLWSTPAGAQLDVHVVWPSATIRLEFLDFGRDGLDLGDRLAGRGPLFDATLATRVGGAHLDCVVVRRITDGPSGPGGLYRCSYLL